MKKLLLCLSLFVATGSLFAQGFSYKAVISDNGTVLQNQAVQVQFSILLNGSLNYQETHSTTTDANGIIILTIGEGTPVHNQFYGIPWQDQHSLKVEIDTGNGYVDFGTTDFKAVPYAKYADHGDWPKLLGQLSNAKSDILSLYLGEESGSSEIDSNLSNTAVGHFALRYNQTGQGNIALGTSALLFHETGNSNTAIGESSLSNNVSGVRNTALGFWAGQNNTGDRNIFLGYLAGHNETGSDKLYIENSDSATPLIGGDFNADEVTINGSLAIADEVTIYGTLNVSGNVLADVTGNLTGDATGNLTGNVTGNVTGNIIGNVDGNITATHSGDADMKAYLFGSIALDGVTFATSSSDGFTSSKVGTGHYKITSSNLNVYTATTTMRYGYIGFITIEKYSGEFHVKTYNTDGVAEDRGFDFIVFKR